MARGRVADRTQFEKHEEEGGTWHETPPVELFKFLNPAGNSPYRNYRWPLPTRGADGSWTPGAWVSVPGPYVRCENGLHLTDAKTYQQWASSRLFAVEIDGGVLDAGDKWVAGKVRLTREILSWQYRSEDRRWQIRMEFQPELGMTQAQYTRRLRKILPENLRPYAANTVRDRRLRELDREFDRLKGLTLLDRANELLHRKRIDWAKWDERDKARRRVTSEMTKLRKIPCRLDFINMRVLEGEEKKTKPVLGHFSDWYFQQDARRELELLSNVYVDKKVAELARQNPVPNDLPAGFKLI